MVRAGHLHLASRGKPALSNPERRQWGAGRVLLSRNVKMSKGQSFAAKARSWGASP